MEQHEGNQHASGLTMTATKSTNGKEIDSLVYDNKVRINHWHDKMMEHKKIYYAAELKMFQLELALAKWDNSNKLRWSVRHREIRNPIQHEPPVEKPKRPKPEPAFGYVPLTRKLRATKDDDAEQQQSEDKVDEKEKEKDKDVIPAHSADYKPFSSTASIHSYMYHLRNIYGK